MPSSSSDATNLPINKDFYTVLECRIYKRSKKRIVALCVLQSQYGTELKLYEWEWRGEDKGWKVGLANLSVKDINLEAIASDAKALAASYGIRLEWDTPG